MLVTVSWLLVMMSTIPSGTFSVTEEGRIRSPDGVCPICELVNRSDASGRRMFKLTAYSAMTTYLQRALTFAEENDLRTLVNAADDPFSRSGTRAPLLNSLGLQERPEFLATDME